MNDFRTAEIKVIGILLMVAGLFGFLMFLPAIFPLDNLISLLNIFPAGLFVLAFYSGYLLLFKEDVKGLEIGRAVVALQIIHFHIAGVGYLFVTGVYVFVGFTNFNFNVSFGIENTFAVNVSEETSNVLIKVNILALIIFMYLTRVRNKIYDEEERKELSEGEKSIVGEDVAK